MPLRKALKFAVLAAAALFVLAQLVPYGHSHPNPAVTQAAAWPTGKGEQLAEQSCYDCHSNLTKWRWYSNVAPISWLVQHDVEDGRGALNFSEWDRGQPPLGEVAEQVTGGGMPPTQYTLIHPSTSLSSAERAQLVTALTGLYAKDPPPAGGG
jgi:mono/diheme cytochrome c family protein